MRKLSLILAVLVLTAPAWARVDITCEQVGDTNEVVVSYNVTEEEPNKVRAFALDITLDNDVNITDVNTSANVNYTIFPGSVAISGGEVTDEGTAVADPCDYPQDTQDGLGSSGATIEMGALYSPPVDTSPNAPPDYGVLLSFFTEEIDCNVTIELNVARGGVVLTNPAAELVGDFNAPGVGAVPPYPVRFPIDCLIGGNAGPLEFSDWEYWGKPDCWCYMYQCRGDSDGIKEYGVYSVLFTDLTDIANSFGKTDAECLADPNCTICSDSDHLSEYGYYRVLFNDLSIIATYFGDTVVPTPCDQADPCSPVFPDVVYTGPYNYWTTP